ncbi:DUF3109 family protein [Elizabethkingia sp. JS20170427COW]|uniref:DUF3109 family protein n=1 Tax=Elizabethkingia sp. JS20170427COW TaxID=2583851 RepID=UPI001110DFDC|nr:DUF3109 family protein [Elizabethkingia sp. JS20170427COW]QCX52764.1 DUF3109 family protein [Elizabethkingia sp. JS20170427COW]
MIQIDDKIVSEDILEKNFVCNLSKCKGICCVEGDSGAPLDLDETEILQEIYPKIKDYLRPEGVEAIEKQGTHVVDIDGDMVTPLVNNQECAYVIFDEKGYTKCGIEKAYEDGVIDYQKPISCHLYPIRITKYSTFDALNYDKWDVCKDACTLGEELKVPVYKFVKKPLIRKYGDKFYEELSEVAEVWSKNQK